MSILPTFYGQLFCTKVSKLYCALSWVYSFLKSYSKNVGKIDYSTTKFNFVYGGNGLRNGSKNSPEKLDLDLDEMKMSPGKVSI